MIHSDKMYALIKQVVFFLLLLCGVTTLNAESRSSFRFGLNYPISFAKYATENSSVGITLGWEHRMDKSPWAWGVNSSYERYAKYTNEPDKGLFYAVPFTFRSITFAPYTNYYFAETKALSPFVGASIGISVDNQDIGVFNGDPQIRPVLAPRCGVTLFKHIEMTLQYYFADDFRSRAIFSLSYKF